jgi:predicted nucleic acid-binding protein
MTFVDILAGEAVFVDANTLAYHFSRHPQFEPACTQFLQRVARQELNAFTSADVLSDVAHRVMTMEAVALFSWPFPGIAQRLKKHPDAVRQLVEFRQAVEGVVRYGVQVLSVEVSEVVTATSVSQQTGLLSRDALIVAVMQVHGLTKLASGDADFDRVPGLTRYAPA